LQEATRLEDRKAFRIWLMQHDAERKKKGTEQEEEDPTKI
jgi:hypothetical protein